MTPEAESTAPAEPKTGIAKLTINSPGTDRSVDVEYNFGVDLAEAVSLFGTDVVYGIFRAKGVIIVQDTGRRVLNDKTKTPEDAVAAVASLKLGVPKPRVGGPKKSVVQRVEEAIEKGTLSAEAINDLIGKLKTSLRV